MDELTASLRLLKISIPVIFERIGCDANELGELLSHKGKSMDDENVLVYFNVIEKRTNEILQMYHLCQNMVSPLILFIFSLLLRQ